jgi:hypothetical protein
LRAATWINRGVLLGISDNDDLNDDASRQAMERTKRLQRVVATFSLPVSGLERSRRGIPRFRETRLLLIPREASSRK